MATDLLPPPESDEIVIDADIRGGGLNLRELWQRRELIFFLAWRDIKVRYRQTWVGAGWALVQPGLMTIVFTIFLGPVVGQGDGRVPYPLYVYSGFLAWNFFANAVVGASMSVVAAEGVITKVYFPRLAIPLASVGTTFADFLIASLGLLPLMLRYGVAPSWSLLLLPAWLLLVALAGFGAGTLFAALNVRYRDFRYVMPFVIQVWMFSTPTIFVQTKEVPAGAIFGSQEILGQARLLLQQLNPVNNLVVSFRAVVLGEAIPWLKLGLTAAVVAVLVAVGVAYFRRVEDTFADVI